jgi:hypothetical protein
MPSLSSSDRPLRRQAALASLLLGIAAAAPCGAQDEGRLEAFDPVADAFISLFNGTCVKYYGSPDKLTADLEGKHLAQVDDAHRGPFLHNSDGTAWSLSNERGDFVIALRKGGGCSVFARRAKDVDAQLLFATLVQQIQVPGAPVTKVADKRDDSPFGQTHYVAYAQQRSTPGPYARFGLTTTPSEKVAVQAVATVSTAFKK